MILGTKDEFFKWRTLVGGCLILLPQGPPFYIGNLNAYTNSFVISNFDDVGSMDAPWIMNLQMFLCAVGTASVGFFVTSKTMKRVSLFVGLVMFSSSFIVASIAIKKSYTLYVALFSILFGLPEGMAIILVIDCVLSWEPRRVGLFISFLRAAKALGSIPVNQFISLYINAANETPDHKVGRTVYFSQKKIVTRIPSALFYLGCGCLVVQLMGFLMMKANPDSTQPKPDGKMRDRNVNNELGQTNEVDREATTDPQPSYHNQTSPIENEQKISLTTVAMIRTPQFYVLFFTFMAYNLSDTAISNYLKSFGLNYIPDDRFYSNLASVTPIFSAIMNVLCGMAIDRYGVKAGLIFESGSLAVMSWLYYFTPRVGRWVFCASTLSFQSIAAQQYCVVSVAVLKIFGRRDHTSNLGFLYLAALGTVVAIPVFESVLLHLGWFYMYLIVGLVNAVSMISVLILIRE